MSKKAPVPETADTFADAAEMWEWLFRGGWIQYGESKMRWGSTNRRWVYENGDVSVVDPWHPTRWRRVAAPRRKIEVTMYQNVYRRPDGSFETGYLFETADEAREETVKGLYWQQVAIALPVTFTVEEEE